MHITSYSIYLDDIVQKCDFNDQASIITAIEDLLPRATIESLRYPSSDIFLNKDCGYRNEKLISTFRELFDSLSKFTSEKSI